MYTLDNGHPCFKSNSVVNLINRLKLHSNTGKQIPFRTFSNQTINAYCYFLRCYFFFFSNLRWIDVFCRGNFMMESSRNSPRKCTLFIKLNTSMYTLYIYQKLTKKLKHV